MTRARRPDPGELPDPRDETLAGMGNEAVAAGEDQSPPQEKSSYDAAPPSRPGRPGPQPLKTRIELVLVSGPEGKQLRMRQAAAIREALRWFAQHPNPHQTQEPS